MPELPIYPDPGGEAPGYTLERRRQRLQSASPEAFGCVVRDLRTECVFETLRLTGAAVEREIVHRTIREVDESGPATEDSGEPEEQALVRGQLRALVAIEEASEKHEEPSVSLIQSVHRVSSPASDGSFRSDDVRPQFATARSSPPEHVAPRLKNLLDWLSAESARSMFPAERMALWFARFVEIAPFERGNFRTAHLLLSFFAQARGYPPVSLRLDEAESVRSEVERAIVFDTRPLVDRFSEALSRSVAAWERVAKIDQ